MAIIYTSVISSISGGWQGYSIRQAVGLVNITNPGFNTGQVRVTFLMSSGAASANLDACYIGAGIASPTYDFDGSQVQLFFGGAANKTGITGAVSFTSDFAPFTFNFSTAVSMLISTHWSGTEVDFQYDPTTGNNNTSYLLQSVGTEGATAPSGSWGGAGDLPVNIIEFIPPVTIPANPFVNDWSVFSR